LVSPQTINFFLEVSVIKWFKLTVFGI
jgi:hypothetical protein